MKTNDDDDFNEEKKLLINQHTCIRLLFYSLTCTTHIAL